MDEREITIPPVDAQPRPADDPREDSDLEVPQIAEVIA